MQRVSTTVVVLVGTDESAYDVLGRASNVRTARPEHGAAPLDRAVTAWARARETRLPYFVHGADPLAGVADAWVRRYDGVGVAGELETAVATTLAHWRSRAIELPDYYLCVGPDAWTATERHWFFGVLAPRSPNRVRVAEPDQLTASLANLPTGRWWPDLDQLLDGVDAVVPDRVGLPGATSTDDSGSVVLSPATLEVVERASRRRSGPDGR